MSKQFPRIKEYSRFVNERWEIHRKRLAGLPAPWTKDEILRTYRFTNVRRADDRVTRWIHTWAQPMWGKNNSEDLWFAFYVARVFNKPETLAAIGWPLPWTTTTKNKVYKTLKLRQANDERIFNGAYLVTSSGKRVNSKAEYYMEVFTELWAQRKVVRPFTDDTLQGFSSRLMQQHGIAGFMAGQVVADIKHYEPLLAASDWQTFAMSGPGSRRGLNWVCGYEPTARWKEAEWHSTLTLLMQTCEFKLDLDAQDTQNTLCEYSKYCKVKHLGGRAKQLFRPSAVNYAGL